MTEPPEVNTAIDAVRCLYLAKEAQRRGDEETAKRWHAKAAALTDRLWLHAEMRPIRLLL